MESRNLYIVTFLLLFKIDCSAETGYMFQHYQEIINDTSANNDLEATLVYGKNDKRVTLRKLYSNNKLKYKISYNSDRDFTETEYIYDSISGNLTYEKMANSHSGCLAEVAYIYLGNFLSETIESNNGLLYETYFHYDSLGKIIQEKVLKGGQIYKVYNYSFENRNASHYEILDCILLDSEKTVIRRIITVDSLSKTVTKLYLQSEKDTLEVDRTQYDSLWRKIRFEIIFSNEIGLKKPYPVVSYIYRLNNCFSLLKEIGTIQNNEAMSYTLTYNYESGYRFWHNLSICSIF